ncbi:hypothetical protein ABMC88_04100, partial [Sulfitobacter sp. HNIBRBA2951]
MYTLLKFATASALALMVAAPAMAQNRITGVTALNDRIDDMVIPPFLMGLSRRIHAAVFSFMAGVMPPMLI